MKGLVGRSVRPKLLSCVQLFVTLGTVALQAPLSMEFSRQECWSGLSCSPPGDLPSPGIEPVVLKSPAGGFFTTSATWEAQVGSRHGLQGWVQLPAAPHLLATRSLTSLYPRASRVVSTVAVTSLLELRIRIVKEILKLKKRKTWEQHRAWSLRSALRWMSQVWAKLISKQRLGMAST